MNEKHYIDLLERQFATVETVLGLIVHVGAIETILVEKGLCSSEDVEETRKLIREISHLKEDFAALESRKAELEELKKDLEKDPMEAFMDLFRNASKEK